MEKKIVILIAIALIAVLVIFFNTDILISQITPDHKNTNHERETGQLTAENPNLGQATNVGMSNNTAISLKTMYVTEYSLPNGTGPNGILVDRNGLVWTAGSLSHKLYSLNETSGELRLYQIPGEEEKRADYMVWSMIEDNDGSIWFSQFGSNPLWRFDPNAEKFTRFNELSASPFQMKVDTKRGDIWFTTLRGNTLGVIQKNENSRNDQPNQQYKIHEFPLGNDTYPSGLFLDEDVVWVTELEKNKIAKFEITRDDSNTVSGIKKTVEIPFTNKTHFSLPTDVLASGNGTIWLTEHGISTISEYNMNLQKLIRFPTSQTTFHVATLPFWMRESPDGKGIWFNEHEGGRVGFLDAEKFELTEYELPSHVSGSIIFILNAAQDPHNPNRMWFSEWNADKIAVVDKSVPVLFNIQTDTAKVVLSDSNESQKIAAINFQIINNTAYAKNHMLYFNVSSSMEPAASLVNITAQFFTDFSLANENKLLQEELVLRDESVSPGNYTLGISVRDEMVIKTIFLDLIVTP
ncbi:MAG: hypothetical protein HY295_02915 [Thaumarchaeota archaeon]|nr:hypothetical protein [Nitrososphaerota archaeon]